MKRIIVYGILMGTLLLSTAVCFGGEAWQMEVTAGAGNATNRLVVGQAVDATEGIDGRYDIPALLSGDIQAYLDLEGEAYWKDIRDVCSGPCERTWTVMVLSSLADETVTLRWNSSSMPGVTALALTDETTAETVDMTATREYSYQNTGARNFTLKVTW
jgi:hypothetical protein